MQFRRRLNHIHGVWDKLDLGACRIRKSFINFYKKIFNPKFESLKCKLEVLGPKRISDQEARQLSAPFSLEEISIALQSLDSNKAPGPDGLNNDFVKFLWSFMKDEFMNVIEIFHKTSTFLKALIHLSSR